MTPSPQDKVHVSIGRNAVGERSIFVQINDEPPHAHDPASARALAAELRATFGDDEPVAVVLDRLATELDGRTG